jgi:hypothetical protein
VAFVEAPAPLDIEFEFELELPPHPATNGHSVIDMSTLAVRRTAVADIHSSCHTTSPTPQGVTRSTPTMESASQPPPIKVYHTSRWPPRLLGAVFLAIGIVAVASSGAVLPLILFGVFAAGTLRAGERTRVEVSSAGVTSVPPFGRPRSYPWSDVGAFVAQRLRGGYGGWAVFMNVNGRLVDLTATRRSGFGRRSKAAVESLAEQLNADLAGVGAGPSRRTRKRRLSRPPRPGRRSSQ